jgi:hypothetical protein
MARRALDLAVELDLVDRGVCFVDWVPYGERESWLLEADVGVSLHRRGVESEFAFRTRLLDYVWCGRPMVVTEGDELADLVSSSGLGRVVAPDDPEAVAEALVSVLDAGGDDSREARFEEARRRFRWAAAIEPLEEFCRNPRRAPDRMRNAWVAPDDGRDEAPSKEKALVAQEFGSEARALSEPLGATYVAEQGFEALYDRLCQVEVLLRFEPPLPASALVFELRSTSQGGGNGSSFVPSRAREAGVSPFGSRFSTTSGPMCGGGVSRCGEVPTTTASREKETIWSSSPGI